MHNKQNSLRLATVVLEFEFGASFKYHACIKFCGLCPQAGDFGRYVA